MSCDLSTASQAGRPRPIPSGARSRLGTRAAAMLARLAALGGLTLLAWLGELVPPSSLGAAAARRPNVLVLLTDDQGWGDLSVHGNRNLETPRIDALARGGAQFERFYVCPVCSPTRAEFLTGRYHARGGVYSTSAGGERLDLDEMTIADTFRQAGYATAAFGKWHNGMQYPYHPRGRGFDEYYGFCSGHWGDYFDPLLEHNGRLVQGRGFLADDLTERAMEYISRHRDRPFFVYVPYNTPHSPMQVPDRWWQRFRDKTLGMRHREPRREDLLHTRAALAMCENIDWNVGRLLDHLEQLELSDDTIVVYFCDNGPNGFRWNGGMRGRKGSTDEGGVRSPLFVRWPGRIPPGTRATPAAAIDLLPTLADLAGIEVASRLPLDGRSFRSLLEDPSQRLPERILFSHWRGKVSARLGNWVLDDRGRLYDLAHDPGQARDVTAEQPAVASRLAAAVETWRGELLDDAPDGRPFPVGHADFPLTQLPARDATFQGGVRRSNRFPNCSFLTHWTSVQDRIAWDVEVLTPGTYEVELYYACPAEDVGATVQLTFGERQLRGRIEQPHDPPLRGAEHDRVPRQESYIKDFRPLSLGRIELPAGRGPLSLQAVEIPGKQALELRLIMLTRRSASP